MFNVTSLKQNDSSDEIIFKTQDKSCPFYVVINVTVYLMVIKSQ